MRSLTVILWIPALLFLSGNNARAGTPSPADWRDKTIYQIVTDRFFDGDPSNNAIEGEYDPSDGYKIHGGDWQGIEEKLDYIQGLGATAIWISPVQKNSWAEYHGYSIRDYYAMAPHFGGMTALRSLVDAAHARGISIILDVIPNHCGNMIDSADPSYPDFHNPGDYTLRWRDSSVKPAPPFDNLSWYHNNGHIDNYIDPNQILGELWGLDDLKTEEASVRDALNAAHKWLIDTTDADGFRIDTVKHVELSFWQQFGPEIHSYAADSLGKSDFFLFGEVFDGSPYNNGIYTGTQAGGPYALDSVLWYPMYWTAGSVFRSGGNTEWLSSVYSDSTYYDPDARSRLVLFLDNHDNSRFMGYGSDAQRDEAKAKLALAWQHTSLGIPCVYYGMEQEFDGGSDPWCREDMWDGGWDFGPSVGDNFDMTAPLYRWLRRLNELRADFPALTRGSQEEVASSSGAGLYAYYRRMTSEETLLVVFNTNDDAETLSIDPDLPAGTTYDLLSDRSFTLPATGTVDIVLGGTTVAIFAQSPPSHPPWVEGTWPAHGDTLRNLGAPVRIVFTETMDHASVTANLQISPGFSHAECWHGRELILLPESDLPDHTTFTIGIGAGAQSSAGDSLGAGFSFLYTTDQSTGPVTLPAGYFSTALPDYDLESPLSLERCPEGGVWQGRLLLGDTGWDRVSLHHDGFFQESIVIDRAINRPAAIAIDRAGGFFDGDLLIADPGSLLRFHTDGLGGGLLEELAVLPASSTNGTLVIDHSGIFGGLAYFGCPERDSIYSIDDAGLVSPFAGGVDEVHGIAFSEGDDWGVYLFAADGNGSVFRIDPSGIASAFAIDASRLNGAAALAFDQEGAFGGDLFAANPTRQEIIRIESDGAVSTFASGFSNLEGGDCIAFDASGDLYAAESGKPGLTRIASVSIDTSVPNGGTPPAPYGFLLSPNAPNPFNPSTRISFELPSSGHTELSIHNVRGELVKRLLSGYLAAGPHEEWWDGTGRNGRSAASGVYIYRLRFGDLVESRRMVLLK